MTSPVNNTNISNVDNNHPLKNKNSNSITLTISMSCDTFWKYQTPITLHRNQFSIKYTNRTEQEELQIISRFLCFRMKQFIQDDLINTGKREMLPKLEEIYTSFHIHGLTLHEILYPYDASNSPHCRTDGKIFICTHS